MAQAKSVEPEKQCRPVRRKRTGWRRLLFPLAAVLLAILPFLLLEGSLRLLDVGTPAEKATAGFGASRLFELDEDQENYRTARHRLLFFNSQQFAREKPERTFRIFGLGGSTIHGRPYDYGSSFLKWMELELNGRDSSHYYETVNCGGLSYASYRLTVLLDEVLHYDPDLIVLATGHNEFLEDRTYQSEKNQPAWLRSIARHGNQLRTVTLARQLLEIETYEMVDPDDPVELEPEVQARLDTKSGYASYHRNEAWCQQVISQYEDSLRTMVAACRTANVPLILVNLGENLRDSPPFKSEHRSGLSADTLQSWQALFDQASELDGTEPAKALELYRQVEAIDDEYALLAFRIARCHDRLGEQDQAKEYYEKARQLDVCPLRMIQELHARLKQVANETSTPLVDAEALALNISPDQIPGNNCFMDHVHPDIGSHQQIGLLLADEAESMGLVMADSKWTGKQRRRAHRNHFRRLGPAYLANGRRRVGWLEHWARRKRLDKEAAPIDPRGHLHLGKKRLDYGEVDQAWQQFTLAIDAEPKCVEEVFEYAFDLFSQGRTDMAEQLLQRLHREPRARTYQPAIQLATLITAVDSGDFTKASLLATHFGDTVQQNAIDPKLGRWATALPELSTELEQLVTNRGGTHPVPPDRASVGARLPVNDPHAEPATSDRPSVSDLIDRAITRNPESAPLYLSRARIKFSKQDYEAALNDVTRSIELAPENVEALKFRAILHMIQKAPEAAVKDLTSAIELDPNDPELFRMRSAAHRRLDQNEEADADLKAAQELAPSESSSD